MNQSQPQILPGTIQPSKYEITLQPDFEKFIFYGKETIYVDIVDATNTITLNSAEIEISSCVLSYDDQNIVSPLDIAYNESTEIVIFRFDTPLPQGLARLTIEFKGCLNDKLRGFYRSRYTNPEGNESYLASTQFEATDARRSFPCWDEPSLKAVFEVTLVIPETMVALCNTPVAIESKVQEGLKSVTFEPSPKMSTYLLAFIVGDLSSVEQKADNGTIIRIWTTRGKENHGQFALDTSVKLLTYFNDYFQIPYPLPKLDHIAIPDFAAGAMENWGAITYREIALLVDPQNSSAGTRQRVASIISHEMAHMWFGDLVTMSWWNDLWLNESFASWMGDKAVDHLYPEWDMWTQFLTADTNRALSLDGLQNSHPIEQQVDNPAEIGQLFDAISYSKGASILRMLEQFLGPEIFRRGLHNYLEAHAYGNARTEDLWDALGSESGQPVSQIMDTWVKQTGYPVLEVKVSRPGNTIDVHIDQKRFLDQDILGKQKELDALWSIPFSIRTASDADPVSVLMTEHDISTTLTPASYGSTDEWIKVNPRHTGFYRVNYSPEELDKLKAPIKNLVLPSSDRLGLQNDTYALSKAGHVPATRFLELAGAYDCETDASVFSDLSSNLNNYLILLRDEPIYEQFKTLGRDILRPAGERMGWDAHPNERHLDALLRSTVLHQLGTFDDESTLSQAVSRFSDYLKDPSTVHPDIRAIVFSLASMRGDRSMFDAMWDVYRTTSQEEEKVRLLVATTRFEQTELIVKTLERSLTSEVRTHDTISVIVSSGSTRRGCALAWDFLREHWTELDRRYGEGGFGLMRLVAITSNFTTLERHDEVERFFREHPAPAADRTIRQSLERIRLNAAWLSKNRTDVEIWFDKR